MRPRRLALAAAALVLAGAAGAEPTPAELWSAPPAVALSSLDLSPELLGQDWAISRGIRIDDLANLAGLEGLDRTVATRLAKKLGPLGVSGVADYSLVRKAAPSNLVSVRVYRFRSVEACRSWWEQKYRYPGWEEHYAPLALAGRLAVESRQMNKRAVAFGNLWLTAHQLGKGDEHLKVLDHVIAGLRSGPAD